jgi:hypothetical protein
MPVAKYRSFEDAEKSLWQFKTDENYYKKLFAFFELFSRLTPPNYPAGIFKYPDLDSANRQKAEWDMQIALKRQEKRDGETRRMGDLGKRMKDDEKNELKIWVDQWRRREEALERIHREEIRRVDTEQSILNLEDAFQHAIRQNEFRRDSGLVEMKRWFSRIGVTSEANE